MASIRLAVVLAVLQLGQTIYIPEEDGPLATESTTDREPATTIRPDWQVDDDYNDDVITVFAGKKKPPVPWGASAPNTPPTPARVPASGDGCGTKRGGRRSKRSPGTTKPQPVRIILEPEQKSTTTYLCPESWKDLDFSAVQELECPENATGWYPFPPDCRKYLNCWKGRGFLQPCAPATLFSPIRRECDYPDKVQCLPQCRTDVPKDRGPYDSDDEDNPNDPTLFVDPNDPEGHSPLLDLRSLPQNQPVRRISPEQEAAAARGKRSPWPQHFRSYHNARLADGTVVECLMEGGTGLAPHPSDCTKFLNCWQGKPHIQSCGPGTVFNPAFNVCDHPRNVPGCGKEESQQGYQPGGRHQGYSQFGNQGYKPPPRKTANPPDQFSASNTYPGYPSYTGYRVNQVPTSTPMSPTERDQFTAASTYPGYVNQVSTSTAKTPSAYRPTPRPYQRELYLDPAQPGANRDEWGHGHGSYGHRATPEEIATGGIIGPLPPGHSAQWHNQHGMPRPGSSSGSPDVPHEHSHHHQQHGHHQPTGFTHSPQWHRDHGGWRPAPAPTRPPTTTTPAPPTTTTCDPFLTDYEDEDERNQDVDLRTTRPPGSGNWRAVLDRTKNSSIPQSGQIVRLRGGPTPLEGYVEVLGPGSIWGAVCDQSGNWTVAEASIVCKMLGYERGAELAWQGRPRGLSGALPVHVEEVMCSGVEDNMLDCAMNPRDAGDGCDLETQAVGLRCYPNWATRCRPGEMFFKGKCYSVVVPRNDRKVDAIAFSQDEAIKHCKSMGGHLLDVNSQEESDFVSEWLSASHPALGSVMTAGVGVAVPGRDLWVWEGSGAPFQYNLWWPGPPAEEHAPGRAPKVGERSLCVLLKKDFPCESWPSGGQGQQQSQRGGRSGFGSWQGARSCAAEYFFWHAEDCAIRQKAYPYVCERPADDVGCLGANTSEYEGKANVSWNGMPCLSWDSPSAVSALRYRVSDAVRRKTLSGHNYCRRVFNNHEPWCYVDAGQAGIRVERCDIPPCAEQAISRAAIHCGPQQFECGPNECIPNVWHCDGEQDCSNGLDEQVCSNYLPQFSVTPAARFERHDVERWLHLDANTCAQRCLDSTEFVCKSFSYKSSTKVCHLSNSNVGETGDLVRVNRSEWTYYELKSLATSCDTPGKFKCSSGKCVNATLVCNGRNDCGDRSDETTPSCSAASIGYSLRLTGGKAKNEGRVEVKVNGIWGGVCDDGFGLPEADVVCKESGYPEGAVEVISANLLPKASKTLPILVDELICVGNETSLRNCDQAGWAVHDCAPEEMVGVRCAVASGLECETAPGEEMHGGPSWGALLQLVTKHCRKASRACPENQWQCESGECVPATLLCDSVDDCKDASDEHAKRCNLPMEMRLAGGRNSSEGRLEVKVYGEWGTVCDDDFGETAATAVCRALGKPGRVRVYKEAHFGQGQGIIWFDNVRCAGNETSIEQCHHEDLGVTNCKHDEDVGVSCLGGGPEAEAKPIQVQDKPRVDVSKYLPRDCGTREVVKAFVPTVQLAKVVSGRGTPRGSYPWQASIRVRAGAKSVHWCGAVLVGPLHVLTAAHCLQDYTKGAYFVRVGDYDSEEDDGSEQEANIHSIHVHEQFNRNIYLESDLALVRVSGAGFTFDESVQPACLPPTDQNYAPGTNCSISGWGSVGTSGAGHSRLLRSAWLPILPADTCTDETVYGKKAIVPGMFCAGHLGGGADSCQGDSGGPMVCPDSPDSNKERFMLYGIISWGHGCGMANKPGVYTHVAHYLDWVHEKIRQSVLED